jgi:hypothetical protein
MPEGGLRTSATSRVVLRLVAYYIVLIGGGTLLWRVLPRVGVFAPTSLDQLFGGGPPVNARGIATTPLDEVTLAVTVAVAMLASIALSLPVAWVYLLTRAKRGYQQSVVQLLIFLATALGLAAAVNLPVAAVVSILFNATVLVLWYSDFGNAPVELDGRIADRRLRRAKQLARTGTFVARIDDEVFQNMTRDQLEGVAERAWRRAKANDDGAAGASEEACLRLRTGDVSAMRLVVEPKLQDYTRQWRMGAVTTAGGVENVEYFLQLKKRTPPDELLSLIRAAASIHVIHAEFK